MFRELPLRFSKKLYQETQWSFSQATVSVVLFTLKSKLLGLLTQYEKTLRLKPKPKHCKLKTGKEGMKAATIFEKLKQS